MSPTRPDTEDLPLDGTLGDFRILREVGRGGMGVVYEAEQLSLHRHVALKVLPFAGTLDPRQLQRFRNEAQAAACLHHTNIVPVYYVGQDRGVHYYAMQFIEGQTLASLIHQLRQAQAAPAAAPPEGTMAYTPPRGPATESAALQATSATGSRGRDHFRRVAALGVQAAEALEYAHQMGVIHRDVKPANLLLDGRGNLWVTDFGLAHVQSEASLTLSGDLVGTLRYMSPEQALAKRVVIDHRTDVYSLGVTLYELLTLRPAFAGKDRQELLRQIAFEEPAAPRRVSKAVPAELETIVLKAVEKNPADRYGTARELADDLRRWLEDKPIRARRPGLVQRLAKWSRRHRALTVSAAAVLLLAVVGLAVSTALIARAQGRTAKALAAEAEQRRVAEEREAETRAVLDFVEGRVFAAARPEGQEGGLGHDVSLRQAVEAALPFVDKSFADQPLIEARLRLTLGKSFWRLGEAKIAAEQFQKARALYAKHLGPDHPDTLMSMNNLANSYDDLGRDAEALRLREETLELRQAKLGPDHLDTLKSMNNLANSYADLGRHAVALKLREETLELCKAKLGPDHPLTLDSMHNLANSYGAHGRHADALKLNEETLALYKAKLGPNHPATFGSMNNLALSYGNHGRHADALTLLEQTLALQKAKLPPNHPDTLNSMNNLAVSYGNLGRHGDALQLHQETLALRKAKLGPDHPATLGSMNNLAHRYRALGRHDEACKLHQETLALRKAKLRPNHPDTLSSMQALAVSYGDLGRHDEARKLREELLVACRAKFGPDHPATLNSMNDLALTYADLGRHGEARKLEEETLALRKAKYNPSRSDTIGSMRNLAKGYHDLGRYAHAVRLSEQALALHKARLGPDHRNTLVTMLNLANSYYDLGRLTDAFKLREETLALCQAKLGPNDRVTLISMNNLAWQLATCPDAKLRDPKRAVELAKKVVELTPAEGTYWNTLGACYYRSGDFKAGIEALEKSMKLRAGGDSNDWFFLAMAHRQLGRQDEARKWYDQAVAWMDRHQPRNAEMRRFRAEAAELLGLRKPPRELLPPPREEK
jgi:serine/threonine protein kinase/tetratricopeptide (TPR) repeat protein